MEPAGIALAVALVAASILFLVRLAVRVSRTGGLAGSDPFGLPDLFVLLLLLLWFGVNALASLSPGQHEPTIKEVIAGICMYSILAGGIFAVLRLRGIPVAGTFGFNRLGTLPAFGKAFLYLLATYPCVISALLAARWLFPGSEPQDIVKLFARHAGFSERFPMILFAVAVAPVVEEILFRGFIHGVAKRFLGFFPALAFNAFLFAAVHLHGPSFPALLLLAVALTLAYETTGSLLVPMAMHSLFNSASLVALIYAPELAR